MLGFRSEWFVNSDDCVEVGLWQRIAENAGHLHCGIQLRMWSVSSEITDFFCGSHSASSWGCMILISSWSSEKLDIGIDSDWYGAILKSGLYRAKYSCWKSKGASMLRWPGVSAISTSVSRRFIVMV
jgi:hypothetical protein